jgi:hypothetical protein
MQTQFEILKEKADELLKEGDSLYRSGHLAESKMALRKCRRYRLRAKEALARGAR